MAFSDDSELYKAIAEEKEKEKQKNYETAMNNTLAYINLLLKHNNPGPEARAALEDVKAVALDFIKES